ncbi:MAG: ABC transporter permease [Acetobacteraceae bacterium]
MQAYIVKRFLLFIPTLLMATLVAFLLLRVIPGDPALVKLAGETGDATFTPAELHDLRVKLGTDQPLYVQYGEWIWGMMRLDFGQSMFFEEPVAKDLAEKFPITLELTVLAMIIATVIAVPLGVISAIRQDTAMDYTARIISIAGVALPNFWVGILIVYFLVLFFDWMPPLGYATLWDDPLTNLQQFFFPALALGFYQMAFTARVTRSSMLEVYREDYTRTARGKGLAERVVILRHALKNALLPVVTISGYQFGRLLAGTVVIENIFMIPGMGKLLIDSVFHRDYTEVQAIVMVITATVLVLNLILDVVYGWLNPRIHYR